MLDSKQPNSITLVEAKAWLKEQMKEDGAKCPCCGQLAKVYRRKLNANMARSLVLGFRRHAMDWFHAPTVVEDRGEMAKLRYWGLVEEERALRPDGGRAGWWHITPRGAVYVQGLTAVPAHALVYDSQLLRLDDTDGRITIGEALGDKFNYRELMAEKLPEGVNINA